MTDDQDQSITALLIVRNEADIIRAALSSIADVVDDIVVVHDGPCEDDTLSIAAEFTQDISILPRSPGSSEFLRPAALRLCRGEWVFNLDADERLSPELRQELRKLVSMPGVDSYSFAWPYVSVDGAPIGRLSLSAKRFLFRRSKMYTVGLPHMTPDTYGMNVSRPDLGVLHILKNPNALSQLRRMFIINRRRGRAVATVLAEGTKAIGTFNADLSDTRVKNARKIRWFLEHPFLSLIFVPAYGFLQRYLVRGYFRAGMIGLHDALNLPVSQAWTCVYRILDRFFGPTRSG